MSEENAYDKFLQNYIMYGMSDPNGLYSQYAQEHGGGGGDGQQNTGYDDKSGSQQRGGYQHNTNNYSSNNTSRNSGYNNRNAKPEVNPDGTITQRDTIFIQNLPKSVTVSELEQAFGSIGIIKIDKKTNSSKIWIYKDKNTGEGKGEATVTYDDEEAANAAINWFNNKEILGNVVKIQLATRKNNLGNFNKGGNRGGYGGGGGYGNRGDDRGGRGGGGGGGYGNRGDDRGGRGGGSGGYGNRGDDRGGRGGGGGGYSGGQGGYGGGNRFNDRNNDRNNESNYNDRNDRNQNRGGGGGGYHNRSNNNYSRPAPY